MKALFKVAALASLVVAPIVSFAQQNQPVTRAQVRAELVRLEQAGYNPNDGYHYPANIQRAEQIVAAQNAGTTAYGANAGANVQAGK